MGGTDNVHHRLKPVTIDDPNTGDSMTLQIPEDWDQGVEDGAWWCGRGDEEVTLFVRSAQYALPGRDADPNGLLLQVADSMRESNHAEGALDGIRDEATQQGRLISSVVEVEEDGERYRHFRWNELNALEQCVDINLFTLVIPVKEVDDPASVELVRLFDDQLRTGVIRHNLKIVSLGDEATIRIPESWSYGRDGDRWWCGPSDSGPTLYVQIDHVLPPQEADYSGASTADHVRFFVDQILGFLNTEVAAEDIRTEEIDGNFLVQAVVGHEEDGETYRTHRWYWVQALGGSVGIARFSLVAPMAEFSSDETADLIEIFDRQVRRSQATIRSAAGG